MGKVPPLIDVKIYKYFEICSGDLVKKSVFSKNNDSKPIGLNFQKFRLFFWRFSVFEKKKWIYKAETQKFGKSFVKNLEIWQNLTNFAENRSQYRRKTTLKVKNSFLLSMNHDIFVKLLRCTRQELEHASFPAFKTVILWKKHNFCISFPEE